MAPPFGQKTILHIYRQDVRPLTSHKGSNLTNACSLCPLIQLALTFSVVGTLATVDDEIGLKF
jgi:hypothetical protein